MLSKEDRIELLKKAREAKANKKAIKEEETEDEEPVVNVQPEPEKPAKKKTGRKPKAVVELPIPVEVVHIEEPVEPVKKNQLPIKWLKKGAEPQKVCCNNKVSKEEYVIDDEKPQVIEDKIVVPPQKEIKKVRKVRASTPAKTLDLTDKPRDIVEVIEDLSQDNAKYLPKVKPAPSAPISIVNNKIRLFDY